MAAEDQRSRKKRLTEEEQDEAWIQRQLAKAPPLTWERWADANLGITVKRRSGGMSQAVPDGTQIDTVLG